MRNKLAIFIALFSFVSNVSAADFPFVDISVGSPYYAAVKNLYDNKVIVDDGNHKFRPDEFVTRDAFVGFLMGATCNSCMNPSIEMLAKNQVSPFPDLNASNPYYYCIAEAANDSIIQGYPLGQDGKVICDDGKTFTQPAFCQENKLSRLMAAVMLLKKANLWNDSLNNGFQKSLTINDVASIWYGYAQKAVQFGLIELSNDGKINPDAIINRGEFAIMASKILDYNQCAPSTSVYKGWSNVLLQGADKKFLNQSIISKDAPISLIGLSADIDNNTFSWKAIDAITGKTVTENGPILSSTMLGVGRWYINLSVLENGKTEVIASSSLTLTISDDSAVTNGTVTTNNTSINTSNVGIGGVLYPSLSVIGAPNTPGVGGSVSFTTNSIGNGTLSYNWDFGDGTRANSTLASGSSGGNGGKIDHSYTLPGIYVVNVVMTDESGKSAQGSVVIQVTGKSDTDGDGVDDSVDVCPKIKGTAASKGCPEFSTNLYTAGGFLTSNSTKNVAFSSNTQNTANTNIFSSNMNAVNSATADTDNDGITDDVDACPTIAGSSSNGGCPLVGSFLGSIESNGCAMNQIQKMGGIIIEPICEVCPCPTTLSLGSALRRCDVIFPAILSKDFLNIYSRGPLYQIP